MTSDEVARIVTDEIGTNWDQSNAHGVDLRHCLVPPVLRQFADPLDRQKTFGLWLVLEEIPETCGGYQIVYSEDDSDFGLAMTDAADGTPIFLGIYGSFMETLAAM